MCTPGASSPVSSKLAPKWGLWMGLDTYPLRWMGATGAGMTITDRQARAICPGDRPISGGETGLALHPSAAVGHGKWIFRFKSPVTRKYRDMGLGTYPDVSVASALHAARTARALVATGKDPIQERDAEGKVPTFERAARRRWEQKAPGFRSEKVRREWISALERHVFPHIGDTLVNTLMPRDFADALRPIWLAHPATAKRVRQHCADVMAACWAEGFTRANPLDVVDRLLPAATDLPVHYPAVPWRDVPSFVRDYLLQVPVMGRRAALLFVILTATRSGEVRGMTWGELDLEERLWTVPAQRMKAQRLHRVPLSVDAVALLRSQWSGVDAPPAGALVFRNLRGGALSDMSLTSILRANKIASDVPGRVATAHGFRSSFKDWAVDHGYSTEISERALAHAIRDSTRGSYERSDRLQARIDMMACWSDHVMGRITPRVAGSREEAPPPRPRRSPAGRGGQG